MPVIQPTRQGLNIGPATLTPNDVQMPSGAGPLGVDTSKAKQYAALGELVKDFGIGFGEAIQENGACGSSARGVWMPPPL